MMMIPTKPLYEFLLCHACHMPHPSHSPSFDHQNEMLLQHTNHEAPPYTVCSSLLLLPSSYIKSKVHPITGHEGPEGEVEPYSFLNLSARWGWLINAMPWPFYP